VIRARPALAAAAAFPALALLAITFGSPTARAVTPPADPVRLTLASQTSWVGPGQAYLLRVNVAGADATGRLIVTVFGAVPNRIEFTRTLNNRIAEPILDSSPSVPLASLPSDATGARTLLIPIQDPTKARDRSRLALSRSGVYPVRVEYRTNQAATDEGTTPGGSSPVVLVTHILYMAGPINSAKLHVAWILPIHASPQPGPAGTTVLSPDQSDRLAALARALDANHNVPVVLKPTPDTVAALADSTRHQDLTTLGVLARPEPRRQLVTGTYVPVPLPGMLAAGLAESATRQLTRGGDELASALSTRPDGRTWVENGPIDQASAAWLRGAQVDRLVVPDQALSANPLRITLAQPFDLVVRPGSRVLAAAADPGLAQHFQDATDPVLAAHQLLADLTVLYLDRPGLTRGVVVDTPPSWPPDGNFLRVFFDAMSTSPMLDAVTLDTLFATVPAATTGRGQPLVRTMVPDARNGTDAGTFPVEALRAAQRRLDGFGSALAEDNQLYDSLERILLTAASSDFTVLHDRQTQIDLVNHKIDLQLAQLQLPSSRTITLTARTGELPITVLSGADYPMRVVLRVTSDKLAFPNSHSTGSAVQSVELHHGNNRVLFTVQARTAGSFPLRISLVSADGQLVMGSTNFTVQSTALSGVGLFLSIGAGLFLAGWWGRHALRGRRARRLLRPGGVRAAT
jgi:hypothetical protein